MRGMSSIAGAAARRACSAGLARGGARRREAVKAVPKMSAIATRGGVKHTDGRAYEHETEHRHGACDERGCKNADSHEFSSSKNSES